MPSFGQRLAGAWAPAISNTLWDYHLANPSSPQDLQKIGNVFQGILGNGPINFSDETARGALNPFTGQFEIMGKNLGLGLNPSDKGAELKFQFGRSQSDFTPPVMMNQFLNEGEQPMGLSPAR